MAVLLSLVGGLIVAMALWDIFHTLGHPGGRGTLTRTVMRSVWRLGRRRLGNLVGPVALLAVIGTWATLIIVGWMLVYLPHMSEGFVFSPGLQPAARADLLDSAYLSLVTVTTLGFGDIVPQAAWLRIATPLQALVGFALLTAAVSWILQVYPALGRRRVFASQLDLLQRFGAASRLSGMDSGYATNLLDKITQGLVQVRVDLEQYSETYYFRESDPRWSLAAVLGYTSELVEAGRASGRADVRLAADMLSGALKDFSELLSRRFVMGGDTVEQVLAGYEDDHGRAQ